MKSFPLALSDAHLDLVLAGARSVPVPQRERYLGAITSAAAMGQIVMDWQLGGFAADPPNASMAAPTLQPLRWCQRWAGSMAAAVLGGGGPRPRADAP